MNAQRGGSSDVTGISDILKPLRPYLTHQSWRCADRGRYPASGWAGDGFADCPCGLVQALVDAGVTLPEALHIAETISEAIP